jgi:hypothetical protein
MEAGEPMLPGRRRQGLELLKQAEAKGVEIQVDIG